MEWLDSRSRALLCSLRCRENDHFIYLANVHLIGTPGKTEDQINQVKSLCVQIEKRKSTCGHTDPFLASTMIVGDFNSNPHAGTYKLFSEGKLPADWKDVHGNVYTTSDVSLPFKVKSAHLEHFGAEPKFTFAYNNQWTDVLDYCFYSPEKLEVVSVLPFDEKDSLFPSASQPSDHLPLVVDLKILVSPLRRPLKSSNSSGDLRGEASS